MPHTPGPWSADSERHGDVVAIEAHSGNTDFVVGEIAAVSLTDEEDAANVRLICAAPDLLAACEAALTILSAYIRPDDFDGHAARAIIMVKDAIEKAKGGRK